MLCVSVSVIVYVCLLPYWRNINNNNNNVTVNIRTFITVTLGDSSDGRDDEAEDVNVVF